MSIEYPSSIKEVADRMRTDVKSVLPDSNPFQLRNSYLNALIVGLAGRLFDIYNQLAALEKEQFMDTAEGEFLERWGTDKNISRNQATQSSGHITITGTALTIIPVGTLLQSIAGVQYSTMQDEKITVVAISVTTGGMTLTGQTVTVITVDIHHLGDGMSVTISGANETEYNGSFVITTTDKNKFTYTITGSPSTPATGTIIVTATFADAEIKSIIFGKNTNQVKGTQISFVTPIAGADNNTIVQFEGLTGGEDLETNDDLRKRIIEAYADPFSNFNPADIKKKAKEVSGVTTIFVEKITPAIGQTTIYFMRYGDGNGIPSSDDVNNVKDKILEILPAHVDELDVFVKAPINYDVDFKFNNLDPNTTSMQAAIKETLAEAFREKAIVGSNFLKIAYESAIWQTVDTSNGDTIKDFSLNYPGSDIPILDNQIAILKDIIFP